MKKKKKESDETVVQTKDYMDQDTKIIFLENDCSPTK